MLVPSLPGCSCLEGETSLPASGNQDLPSYTQQIYVPKHMPRPPLYSQLIFSPAHTQTLHDLQCFTTVKAVTLQPDSTGGKPRQRLSDFTPKVKSVTSVET